MSKQSNVQREGTARIFKSSRLEAFTNVHPATPLILYVPLILFSLYQAYTRLPGERTYLILVFLSGLLFWTLTEYLIHRFVFHMEGRAPWQERMKFVAHGVHHDYPNDARRLVMPPVVSIPIAVVSFCLFYLAFGSGYVFPFYAGFVLGYLCYDMLHFAFHHFRMTGRIPKYLRAYHLRHHFKDDGTAYGVSSPLWDHVFRTVPDTKDRR